MDRERHRLESEVFDALGFYYKVDQEVYFSCQPDRFSEISFSFLLENAPSYCSALMLGVPCSEVTSRLLAHFKANKAVAAAFVKARARAEQQIFHSNMWRSRLGFVVTPQGDRSDGQPEHGEPDTSDSDEELSHSASAAPAPIF